MTLVIYCDASRAKDICVGALVVKRQGTADEVVLKYYPNKTSMEGEILVCLDSIEYALKHSTEGKPCIYTDYKVLYELAKRCGKNLYTESNEYELIEKVAVYLREGKIRIRQNRGNKEAHVAAKNEMVRLRNLKNAEKRDEWVKKQAVEG